MSQRSSYTYQQVGVDLEAADEIVRRIAPLVRRTYGPRVVPDHGGFAGAFRLDYDERIFARNYREPVLVACTDGVGSKVLLAAEFDRLESVGQDLVAMNVNDLLTSAAEPLFFLDYIAAGRLRPEATVRLIEGIAAACERADCALLGGECAEMPDLYRAGQFDLAGFAVGVVERRRLIRPRRAGVGDVLLGLASSGLHSNGYALARHVLLKQARLDPHAKLRRLGEPLIDALLRPTRIYVRSVLAALRHYRARPPIRGMAHITGGGLPGNVARILRSDADAVIRRGSWPIPPIFGLLEHHGVAEDEMYRVFNMGIGFVLAVRPRSARVVARMLERAGEQVYTIGRIRRGRGRVELR